MRCMNIHMCMLWLLFGVSWYRHENWGISMYLLLGHPDFEEKGPTDDKEEENNNNTNTKKKNNKTKKRRSKSNRHRVAFFSALQAVQF